MVLPFDLIEHPIILVEKLILKTLIVRDTLRIKYELRP